ncbi:hypothetical protein V8E55_009426 [Tylopilus felleus]
MTSALHTVHCIHPPMSNYVGVIGLCGVVFERALRLALDGYITIEKLQAFKSNNPRVPKTPLKLNEYSGKESNMVFVFSDQNWGEATRTLTARVEKCTDSEITSIVDAAQKTPLFTASKSEASASSSAPTISIYMRILWDAR